MTNICRWLFLLYFLTTWTVITNSKEIRVVCYYTNWSVYRPGTAKFSPQNINPYLCTHLVYAFGGFTKENTLKPFDKYQDIEKGGYAKFTGLKTYNKNLKTLLAIGGWNEGSSRFSPMVANADRRKELIKNAIKFLRQNHFDGLDLDWEYPSFRDGGKARDKDNYAQLVQELREEFERESEKTGRPRLLLTMAVPAGIEYINKGYDIPKLTKYLDWMNILSYDYHSAFEPAVNHHAPMYSLEEDSEYNYDADLNIDHTVKHYLKLGALPNKLVVGIPTYGRSYTLFNSDANEIGAPADGPGDMGEATRENGYLAYYEICDYVKSQGWEVVQPNPDAMGPYAFKENQWVGYDDQAIARKKAEYVVENDLGGIMFWSIDNDDFRGNCHGKPYPIIEAAKEALIQASGLTDENLISPKKPTKTKPRTRTRLTTSTTTVATVERKKNRRRNRISSKSEETKARRKEVEKTAESLTHSSLKVVTPAYTTPEPPSTPDGGGSFKCEDEGFFPHPKDCKKYFWCLSGAGGLGIVAHQFTCPAGLYFNKAADSCDYTQNVLCNKKIQKTTTTTTSTTVAPKTTSKSATSRPSLPRTTTTEAPVEEEYEEYDDEEDIIDKNAEEDPKVIKELLDLIRKAGGIEELEKQLNFQDSGSKAGSNSSFNKHLVQKVLSTRKTLTSGQRGSFINRNSRGPQNEGIEKDSIRDKEKSRPKYVTLARDKTKTKTDEDEVEESQDKRTSNKLEYTNIRRGRISSTTEAEEGANLNRNKLGEDELEEYEDDEINTTRKSVTTPQYVNIRRQRPSTTEGTTSKYIEIRRGSTTEAPLTTIEENVTQRGSTTTSVPEQSKTRGTTTKSSQADELTKYKTIQRGSTSTTTESSEIRSTTLDDIISRLTTLVAGSSASTESATTQPPIIISSTQRTLINLENTGADVIRTKPPQLFEPRPFSISTQTTSIRPITETTTTKVTKVSESNSIRTRRPSRFSFSTTEQSRTPNPTQRSRKRFTTTTTENSLNYEELDLGRNFRPSEIADLSSLTAVDIGVVKGAGNRFGSSRRRIISTTHRPKIDRRPITINDLSDLVESGSDVNKSVSSTEKPSFRNRKIIRRLRPSTTSISRVRSTTETIRAAETSSSPLFRRRISRFSTTTSLDNIKPVTVAPLQSRRFTKSTKLDVTTEKLKTDRNDDVEDEADNEASEEGENIKLSESNIRENNDINNNNRISSEDGKKIRTKVLKRVTNSDVIDQEEQEEEVPRIRFNFRDRLVIQEKTTEPNVIKRTRKIIRKLTTESTTPTSTTESAEVTLGRKRKIIRRLRPTVATKINKLEDRNEGDKLKEANKIRFRPRSTTVSSIEEHNSSSTAAATEKEFTENKTFTEQQIKTVQTLVKENDSTTLKDEDLNEEIVETTSVITETDEDTELTTIVLPTTEGKSTTPYVNRILEKQRNRPVFVRPKLTTQSPTSTTTVKTRFRGNRFSTISTPRPTTESRYSRRSTTPRTTSSTTSTTTPSTTSSVETTSTTVSPSTTTVTATSLADTSTSGATTSRIITTPEDETEDIITTFDNEIFDKTTVESTTETLTKLRTSTEEIDSTIPPVGETTTEEHFYDTTIILHDLSTSRIPKEDEEPETTIIDQTTSTSLIIENLSWKSSTPVTTSPASTTESPETSTSQNFESSTVETESRPITESENLSSTPRNRFILRGKTTEKPATEEKLTTARSRLSFRDRNKVKTTETSEDTVDAKVEPSKPTSRRRFNYRGRTTEKTAENEEVEAQTVDQKPLIPVGRSRFLLKNKESAIKNKNSRTQSKEEVTEGQEESVEEPKSRLKPSRGFQNKKNKSISTESPKEEINADAIKARNRNLFSNKRKANTPFAGIKVESSTQTIKSTTYNEEPESNTLPSTIIPDTTDEYLSTLHHIFAEVEAEMETTTPLNTKNNSESKVEKLIEVSRITEVHNNDDSKEERILIDKIGAINRVTSIKIVDPKDNEIFINNLEVATVKQVPNNNNNRQDRKYEIYGNSKVSSSKTNNVKAEIIGGLSNINVITPRPYYSTEASTIALEGLFQTTPKKLLDNQDELLETDNSKFVSVRVLEQDNGRDFGFRDDTEIVPIKVLPQDEYIKARVVEVTPSSKNEKIKIVPIKFEMSRKLIN